MMLPWGCDDERPRLLRQEGQVKEGPPGGNGQAIQCGPSKWVGIPRHCPRSLLLGKYVPGKDEVNSS